MSNGTDNGKDETRTRFADLALSQLLPTGATLGFGYNLARTSVSTVVGPFITPGTIAGTFFFTPAQSMTRTAYSDRANLELNQPLLRGFGPSVTNAGIRIAQYERQGAAADFENQIQDQLSIALQTYWELIGTIDAYKVQLISYAAGLDLIRVNRAKYEAGVLPLTDVLQAEAFAAERFDLLIQAFQRIRELEDQLKRVLFLDSDAPAWHEQIRPTQQIAWREFEADPDQTIEVALANRAELRRAQSDINQAETNLTVARNQRLPALNAFGRVEPTGQGRGFDEGFNSLTDAESTNYSVGLEFSYPLQNRAARYRFRQALARRDQTEEIKRDVTDQVVQEVRRALRDLRAARARISATQTQVVSEQAKLDAERKRYDVGISTAFEVLSFQEDLANAQIQHLRSVVDYNRAAVQLERARGTLPRAYGVEVEGVELTPPAPPVVFPIGWH